jgi:cytidine deaminase
MVCRLPLISTLAFPAPTNYAHPSMPSNLTPAEIAALHTRATEAAQNSYSPYSRFRVGAAILLHADATQPGVIVAGTNVENASYRLTSCAEQSAIAAAVTLYGPAIRIRAVAVANLNGAACMPCGACRQTILEFASPETPILYPDADGQTISTTLADLLPAAFQLKVE